MSLLLDVFDVKTWVEVAESCGKSLIFYMVARGVTYCENITYVSGSETS